MAITLRGILIRIVLYPLVIFGGTLVVVVGLSWFEEFGTTGRRPNPAEDAATIDLFEYNSLSDGVSYDRAVEIVGYRGTEVSRASGGGIVTVMIQWVGYGDMGANANAMFQDGHLISTAQYGLR